MTARYIQDVRASCRMIGNGAVRVHARIARHLVEIESESRIVMGGVRRTELQAY